MGCIKPNKVLQNSEGLAKFISFLFKENKISLPKLSLFEILLSKTRDGLDSDEISESIISQFNYIGLPTGPLDDGTQNVMEEYTKIVVENIVDSIQNDMNVQVAIEPGLPITANGANSGGPVVVVGQSTGPHSGGAVAR
jgi:hypothetical protein